jgi:hypothetical protein
LYRNFIKEKVYGKYIAWPQNPKFSPPLKNSVAGKSLFKIQIANRFLAFSDVLKRVYTIWRAKKMVKSLNKEQQAEMRQKVHALDIFKGKKPWEYVFFNIRRFILNSCARRHEADYLEMDSNPLKDKYLAGVQNLFQTYGETHIIFSDYGKNDF